MKTNDEGWGETEVKHGRIARARAAVSRAIGHAPALAGNARDGAEQVAAAFPDAFDKVRTGAGNTVTKLQTMSDSALRLLTVGSIGLGAGLRLAGAPRLVTLAGFAPASVFGFAILSRPRRSHQAAATTHP